MDEKPIIEEIIEKIPPAEIRSNSWGDHIQFMKVKLRVWQLVLILLLTLGIILAIIFGINSFMSYRTAANNNELAQQLDRAKLDQLELQKITSEALGELRQAKIQSAQDTAQREQAEEILKKDTLSTNEKLNQYENAKKSIVTSNYNATTVQLCERAAKFGIRCDTR